MGSRRNIQNSIARTRLQASQDIQDQRRARIRPEVENRQLAKKIELIGITQVSLASGGRDEGGVRPVQPRAILMLESAESKNAA